MPEWLTAIIAVTPFFLSFFLQILKFPSFLKYGLDVAWCLTLALTLAQIRLSIPRHIGLFLKLIGIMFLYTLVTYLFNYQSFIYYLWGFRNNFRFYIAFLAFAMYLRDREVAWLLKMMDVLFWINAGVTFLQFFLMGYRQDYLGGIFGIERGCNAYTIIFFGVVVSKAFLDYMNGQIKAVPCFLKAGASLVIAAMAELKVYFLFFPLMLLIAALITKFSFRKLGLILGSSVLVMIGSALLADIFGSGDELSLQSIFELITAQNYATAEDLGRFTAIPTISERFLTDLPGKLFGMGLGNCETSAFPICNTPFFKAYSYLHYTWFSSAMLFLETGYVGLGLNLSFFVVCFICAWKRMKSGSATASYCQIAMIMSVICAILTFYNSSLRAEGAYIAYFALAMPFVREDTGD